MNIVHKKIEQIVKGFLSENMAFEGIEIFDVTFRRERAGNILRITIDGENVGLDECVKVNNFVSKWLEEKSNIEEIYEGKYYLEVSTPGVDRPLKNREDFFKNIGKLCKITLKNPTDENRKNFKGKILNVELDFLYLYVQEESKQFKIDIKNIKKARLEIEF
jgi:ribosome maturation factor RimP